MINTIQEIPFFSVYSENELQDLSKLLKEEVFTENRVIFQKWEHGNKMYFIVQGAIKIFDLKKGLGHKIAEAFNIGDKEEEIKTLMSWDFFGEMALISQEPRLYSAKATLNTVTYSINKNDLKEFINSNFEAEKILAETFVKRVMENNQAE